MAQKWEYFWNISGIFRDFFFRMKVFPAFRRPLPNPITMETPPKRKRGTEVSLGRRYAMTVEIALTILLGNSRVPKGILGPLAEGYGVGSDYPRKHWAECKAQIDETGELDLSNKRRSGRPSRLTPTKSAEYDGATLERVWQSKASSRFTTKHSVS